MYFRLTRPLFYEQSLGDQRSYFFLFVETTSLIEKIEKAGAEQAIEATVDARPVDDLKNHLADKDVVLLGPQVRFKEKQVKEMVEGKIPAKIFCQISLRSLPP